jgi:hypothetical protein
LQVWVQISALHVLVVWFCISFQTVWTSGLCSTPCCLVCHRD